MAKDPTDWDDLLFKQDQPERVPADYQMVFPYQGWLYEVALIEEHARELDDTLRRYAEVGRRTSLRVPQLPKEQRLDLPLAIGLTSTVSPPPTSAPAPQKPPSKPAAPAFAPAESAKKEFDRSLPGGSEMPERFWELPKDADYPTRMRYKKLRKKIWIFNDEKVRQGRIPEAYGYAWGRAHPDEVWDFLGSTPS